MRRDLNDKQKRFVEEYLIDGNATAAAGRAGYSDPNYGRQLITFPNVAAAVTKAQEKRAKRVELDQDWVLNGLKEEAEFHGEGTSHSARVRARELIGKHVGMWSEVGSRDNPLTIEFVVVTAAPDPARNGFHRPQGIEVQLP